MALSCFINRVAVATVPHQCVMRKVSFCWLTIDVVEGRGGMFSLDNGRGKRFLTRSDVCEIEGRR